MQLATEEVGSVISHLLDNSGATACLQADVSKQVNGHGDQDFVVHSRPPR
jgi:hypothetical protein